LELELELKPYALFVFAHAPPHQTSFWPFVRRTQTIFPESD